MKLYFMRHGQTNYNLLGLCNDDPKQDVHLTETGKQQARDAAEKLRSTPLSRIVVSELPRTRETAEIINRYHGVEIQAHPGINDIRTGFDSRPVADYFHAIRTAPLTTTPPGGESLLAHKQRVFAFLDELQSQQPEDQLLVIAHEETLRAVACYFKQLSDQGMQALNFENCQVLEFDTR